MLSVFISSLFLCLDSFAVSDLSVTISNFGSSSPYTSPICANQDCSTYRYVTIQANFTSAPANGYLGLVNTTANNFYCVLRPAYSTYTACEFTSGSDISALKAYFNNYRSAVGSVTITLSENSPFASPCPDCEICPVIPENPYDNKLDQLTRAVYVCAGTMLVLYFFYCLYRLIIKNSGVK